MPFKVASFSDEITNNSWHSWEKESNRGSLF